MLRTWMPGDAPRLLEIMSEPEVRAFLPTVAAPTADSIRAALERTMEEEEREGFSIWPVVRKEDGRLIGRCGLHRMPDGWVEIVWSFERSAWGKGYASEAAAAVLAYARTALHLERIAALIDPRNARSIAVAHRLHLRFDRVVRAYKRDLLRYLT